MGHFAHRMSKHHIQILRIAGGFICLAASALCLVDAFRGSPFVSTPSSVLDGTGFLCLSVAFFVWGVRRRLAAAFSLAFVALSYGSEIYLLCTGRGRWLGFIALTILLTFWLLGRFGLIRRGEI